MKESNRDPNWGGKRPGAGRKSRWIHHETVSIRIPKAIKAEIEAIAYSLDRGLNDGFNLVRSALDFESLRDHIQELIVVLKAEMPAQKHIDRLAACEEQILYLQSEIVSRDELINELRETIDEKDREIASLQHHDLPPSHFSPDLIHDDHRDQHVETRSHE
jgi:hypothetical protein